MSSVSREHLSLEELIDTHRPVLFFHPQEEFFPCDFEAYTQAASIQNVSMIDVVQSRPEINFYTARVAPFSRDQEKQLKLYYPNEQELANVPLFVCFKQPMQNMLLITYAFVFNYGDDHFADVQYITVHLEKLQVKRIYFSRHEGGQWVDKKHISYLDGTTRPLVYVAKNNHACYPDAGIHFRYWGFCWDRCSQNGRKWDPQQFIYIPETESACFRKFKWMFFQGSLSHEKYVPSFVNRNFMNHIDMDRNYGYGCCWFL